MVTAYILYNPGAGHGVDRTDLASVYVNVKENQVFCDVTNPDTYGKTLKNLDPDDYIIVCGGDGTLNHFVNNPSTESIENRVYYYPSGSGNDFAHDMGALPGDAPFEVTDTLKNLPTVSVNGKSYKFINGVGYGIDGYCCQVGDELKKKKDKKIDYTAIAIKGLLFHYSPTSAKVTVDGKSYSYSNVWIAPTMNGRYYGGGMIPTPGQRRDRKDGKISLLVFSGKRLTTLMRFPTIFKGEHTKFKNSVAIHEGVEITVEFDRPTPLQIDGETILGVTKYTAYGRK